MTITIPDGLKLTEGEALLSIAVGLVAAGEISSGKGAEICEMDAEAFRRVLKERRIETYTEECLEQDLRVVDEMRANDVCRP